MKNKKYIFLTAFLVLFVINSDIVIESVKNTSILFFTKIFVSTFPFIILSDILIYYDYHIFLSKTIGKFISKLFRINPSFTIAIILSMLTSEPGNAIYINNLLESNEIDINTANRLIMFTYFPSISFVIGSIGVSYFGNIKIGVILLISNYICNLLVGLYLRRNISLEYTATNNKEVKKVSLVDVIKSSIFKSFDTLLIILGNMIIFTIIINIINNYININPILNSILSGILELTNGIDSVSKLNIP